MLKSCAKYKISLVRCRVSGVRKVNFVLTPENLIYKYKKDENNPSSVHNDIGKTPAQFGIFYAHAIYPLLTMERINAGLEPKSTEKIKKCDSYLKTITKYLKNLKGMKAGEREEKHLKPVPIADFKNKEALGAIKSLIGDTGQFYFYPWNHYGQLWTRINRGWVPSGFGVRGKWWIPITAFNSEYFTIYSKLNHNGNYNYMEPYFLYSRYIFQKKKDPNMLFLTSPGAK